MRVLDLAKKKWKYILTAVIALIIGASIGPTQEQVDQANAEIETLNETVSALESEKGELQTKVEEAAPWFKMSDEEKKQKEKEAQEIEAKRLAEEKAKAEAEAQAKAEAEAQAKAEAEEKERIGFETGITYDQLARNPDDYITQKVKFSGKVVQVMEGDGETQIRLAVNNDYDTILYGAFLSSTVESRILEDDQITIYGVSTGLITYQSTMGGNISIPGVMISKIE